MTTITTIDDYEVYTGVTDYNDVQIERITYWLGQAERYLRRLAGWTWYDASDIEGDASQDWLLATSMVAERSLTQEDPAYRAVVTGPYKSEKLGDYSYEIRGSAAAASFAFDPDPRINELIAMYAMISALPVTGMVLAGPTRVAVPVLDTDPDVDVSTWGLEGGER